MCAAKIPFAATTDGTISNHDQTRTPSDANWRGNGATGACMCAFTFRVVIVLGNGGDGGSDDGRRWPRARVVETVAAVSISRVPMATPRQSGISMPVRVRFFRNFRGIGRISFRFHTDQKCQPYFPTLCGKKKIRKLHFPRACYEHSVSMFEAVPAIQSKRSTANVVGGTVGQQQCHTADDAVLWFFTVVRLSGFRRESTERSFRHRGASCARHCRMAGKTSTIR